MNKRQAKKIRKKIAEFERFLAKRYYEDIMEVDLTKDKTSPLAKEYLEFLETGRLKVE